MPHREYHWVPASLALFSCLIAIFISSLVSVPLSISRSWAAGKMSGGFCGGGLVSNSSKYSFHLFLCCSSHTICLPVLFFTGLSGFPNFPTSCLVVSYRPFKFPTLAACSAASASPSRYFLSALMPFLVFL